MANFNNSASNPGNINKSKNSWIKPQIKFIGHASSLIKGGGKTGSVADADPQTTFKSGAG